MKKIFKTFLLLIILVTFYGFIHISYANTSTLEKLSDSLTVSNNIINKISMDIYIDNNGDAKVIEIWDCNIKDGTYLSHEYSYLQMWSNSFTNDNKFTVKDLKVSENNNYFENITSWSSEYGLSDTNNKCAIIESLNGYGIYWGLGSYGKHTYKLEYTITDYIKNLNDSQISNCTLLPVFSPNEFRKIEKLNIRIHSNHISPDTTNVYIYGKYLSKTNIGNNFIELDFQDSIISKVNTRRSAQGSTPIRILLKFPAHTFECKKNIEYNFSTFVNMCNSMFYRYFKTYPLNLKTSILYWGSIALILTALLILVFILDRKIIKHKTSQK